MQKLVSLLLVAAVLLLGVTAYQQNQILVYQKAQAKQTFHGDLISLLQLTDDAGLSKLLSKNSTEFSPKEQNLVALLIQRLIVAKDLRPAFTESEWQAMLDEGKDAFKLPIFQSRWNAVKVYYDKDTVNFVETNFLAKNKSSN